MIGNSLKRIRRDMGLSQAELASVLNIATSSLAEYETDKKDPRPEGLMHICKVLNTTPNYLYGFVESTVSFVKPIPVLGVIRAGLPLLAEENWSEQITVGQFERGADFALRVSGDSMVYAGVRDGDIVLMKQAPQAQTGQIVAAILHDMTSEATLKYYVAGNNRPVLRAANPAYPDQEFTSSHRIIGVFCGLVRTQEPSMHEYQTLMAKADALEEQWRQAMAELTSAGLGPKEVVELIRVMRQIKK